MWTFTGTEPTLLFRENVIIFLSDGEDITPDDELEEICEFNRDNG